LSEQQAHKKYITEKKKALKLNDPFFEQGTHWCLYTPSTEKKHSIYLTMEGVTYWAMGCSVPKANIVRSWISRQYIRQRSIIGNYSNITLRSPVKKRSMESIDTTPKRKRHKIKKSYMEEHPELVKALNELKKIELENSVVYFIWDGSVMKIGLTTKGAENRKCQLQTGNSTQLEIFKTIQTSDPKSLEKFLHSIFKEQRVRKNGEWFKVTKKEIKELTLFLES
jgi:hypothetical protein